MSSPSFSARSVARVKKLSVKKKVMLERLGELSEWGAREVQDLSRDRPRQKEGLVVKFIWRKCNSAAYFLNQKIISVNVCKW